MSSLFLPLLRERDFQGKCWSVSRRMLAEIRQRADDIPDAIVRETLRGKSLSVNDSISSDRSIDALKSALGAGEVRLQRFSVAPSSSTLKLTGSPMEQRLSTLYAACMWLLPILCIVLAIVQSVGPAVLHQWTR